MLDQAILDAKGLKEAAIRNARQGLVEKYASEFEDEIEKLLEQTDPMAPAGDVAPPTDAVVPPAGAAPVATPAMPAAPVGAAPPIDPEVAKNDSDSKSSLFDKLQYGFQDGEIIGDTVFPTGEVEIDLDSLSEFGFKHNQVSLHEGVDEFEEDMPEDDVCPDCGEEEMGCVCDDEDDLDDETDESDEEDLEDEDSEEAEEDLYSDEDSEDGEEKFEMEFDTDEEDELEEGEIEDDDELDDYELEDNDDELEDEEELDPDDCEYCGGLGGECAWCGGRDEDEDDFDDDEDMEDDEDFDDEDELEEGDTQRDKQPSIETVIEKMERLKAKCEKGKHSGYVAEITSMIDLANKIRRQSGQIKEALSHDLRKKEGSKGIRTKGAAMATALSVLVGDIRRAVEDAEEPQIKSALHDILKDAKKLKSGLQEAIKLDWKRTGPRSRWTGVNPEEASHDFALEELQAEIEKMEQDVDQLLESEQKLKAGLRESIGMIDSLTKENNNYRKNIKQYEQKLQETRILNYKLLYTNKVLANSSLNERQKTKIAESIESARTTEEVKLLYETLQSTMREGTNSAPKSLSEAVERRSSSLLLKANRKEEPKQDDFAGRMKRLAGLN